jgi:hypothetical protein
MKLDNSKMSQIYTSVDDWRLKRNDNYGIPNNFKINREIKQRTLIMTLFFIFFLVSSPSYNWEIVIPNEINSNKPDTWLTVHVTGAVTVGQQSLGTVIPLVLYPVGGEVPHPQ